MNVSSTEVLAVDFKKRPGERDKCLIVCWRNIIVIPPAGTGESWLFSLDRDSGDLDVYKWTTENQLFMKVRHFNLHNLLLTPHENCP